MRLLRLISTPLALVLTFGLAGCSIEFHKNANNASSNNNGDYITAGKLTYQLQISRELNQYSVEDHQYLTGLPAGTTAPTSDQLWYGVFLWAKNNTKQPLTTTDSFDIVDTEGNKYYPIPLDSSVNQYAWTATTLQPLDTEPGPDTTAAAGPTGGGMVLFKLNDSVYANRPLTLQIHVPGQTSISAISLDL